MAPSAVAIQASQQFIGALPPTAIPSISSSVEGGVLLEWVNTSVELTLEIRNNGSVEAYVGWESGSEVEGSLDTMKQEVLDALATLLSPG